MNNSKIKIHLEAKRLREKYQDKLECEDIIKYKDTEILRTEDFKRMNLYKILKMENKRSLEINDFKKVLHKNYLAELKKYHPDIYKGDKNIPDGIYYAFNILNDAFWRKKYDDYFIDEEKMPWSEMFIYKEELKEMNPEAFFIIFSQILFEYEKHSKFNKKSPSIGHLKSSAEEIQKFYSFWDNFESKRSFDICMFYYGVEILNDFQEEELVRETENKRNLLFKEHMKNFKDLIKLMKEKDPRIQTKNKMNFEDENFTEKDLKNLKKLVKQFSKGKKISWPFVVSKLSLENNKTLSLAEIQKKYEQIKNKKI